MEESGHYYTVYITSLAVGFKRNIAFRHAVLAQMPDEVGWLDAANLHTRYCVGNNEVDLNGQSRRVPNEWRYLIETALHSLTGGSSTQQRRTTSDMLLRYRADSLEFGLLLHRIGDTYAHSIMGNERELYRVNRESVCNPLRINEMGHAFDGHDPDYPFLRQNLFFTYLNDLHRTLSQKAESERLSFQGSPLCLVDPNVTLLTSDQLTHIFRQIFSQNILACVAGGLSMGFTQYMFIEDIRRACKQYLQVEMENYSPENQEPMSLPVFLSQHPDLSGLVGRTQLETAIRNINSALAL